MILQHADLKVVSQWCSDLNDIINGYKKRPRHLLVFVNPFGGKGRGKRMWDEMIFDIFTMSGVKCKVGASSILYLTEIYPYPGNHH